MASASGATLVTRDGKANGAGEGAHDEEALESADEGPKPWGICVRGT